MYCSHCGKKITDTMLFCPFCGDPIVIPDQDEPEQDSRASEPAAQAAPQANEAALDAELRDAFQPAEAQPAPSARDADDAAAELLDWSRSRQSYADAWAEREETPPAFSPLRLDEEEAPEEDWREAISRKKQETQPVKKPPEMRTGDEEPVRLEGSAPKLEAGADAARGQDGAREKPARKPANTLVPPKPLNPKDMFMDDADADFDDYDAYDDPTSEAFAEAGFAYEDAEESSFFARHLRGIVGLALFVILILMFVVYAFSKAGQLSLARINLAWSTEAYSTLGYQSYQDGRYAQAGGYYERALARDEDNYGYASSAAMAYVEAGDTEKAAAMLKRCIEISPDALEPYVYLLNLYPEAAQRPWDVTQLLQQGYRQTGDARLNVTG